MRKDGEPRRSWWSENAAAIAYTGIGAAFTLPVVLFGISFSMSKPRTSEPPGNSSSPAIDLRSSSPMPSIEATNVLFESPKQPRP